MIGAMGDAACFSLCKGKNISTFNGGIATTNSDDVAERIRLEKDALPKHNGRTKAVTVIKLLALSLVMRPFFYKLLYPLIEPFKSTEIHTEFAPFQYTDFQSAIGQRLLERLEDINLIRKQNGKALIDALGKFDSLMLPKVIDKAEPVFNHLPILVKKRRNIAPLCDALWAAGIDTARMYERPIHQIYDLGYNLDPDPFPASTYVAERLVTLPTHPYLRLTDLHRISDVFENIFT